MRKSLASIDYTYSYQVDMDYEKTGNVKAIQEFLSNENMYCIVMLKQGTLKMRDCIMSLEYVVIF